MLSTPARRLVTAEGGEIGRLTAVHDGKMVAVKARRAVILACGGFEANAEMQRQYLAGEARVQRRLYGQHRRRHPHGAGGRRRAVAHVALPRRLRLPAPDPDYPFGIRPKRLPDWIPGEEARADVACRGSSSTVTAGAT